ncbi:hypothetical protein [Phormidesmis sp. 146-33]
MGIQYELRQLATATTKIAERIESTNEGIDRLKEMVTTGFDELKRITQQQAETARMQAESVDRLVALLERRDA